MPCLGVRPRQGCLRRVLEKLRGAIGGLNTLYKKSR